MNRVNRFESIESIVAKKSTVGFADPIATRRLEKRPVHDVVHGTSRINPVWQKADVELQTVIHGGIAGFALACVVVSTLAAIAYWFGGDIPSVRGPSFGAGCITAMIGSGVAIWFSIRGEKSRVLPIAFYSLLPLFFWCWVIFEAVKGR